MPLGKKLFEVNHYQQTISMAENLNDVNNAVVFFVIITKLVIMIILIIIISIISPYPSCIQSLVRIYFFVCESNFSVSYPL